MRLPDLLRERGIDPEDFLARAAGAEINIRCFYRDLSLIRSYVDMAFRWIEQPEGAAFWKAVDASWRESQAKDRWPLLEAAMGYMEPLEAELMEVEDEFT